MAYTWDKANAAAPSTRKTQYFEMFANRGLYHDGWYACTTPPAPPWLMGTAKMPEDVINGYKWELYDLTKDFSQNNDLAAKKPDKLRELQEMFLIEATKYNVFPLDNSCLRVSDTPAERDGRADRVHLQGRDGRAARQRRPEHPEQVVHDHRRGRGPEGGGDGMLATLGGRFAGYGLYVLKGKPVFTYNFVDLQRFRWEGKEALAPGKHTIVFDFTYDGPGFGKGGTGVLTVDGKEVASRRCRTRFPS